MRNNERPYKNLTSDQLFSEFHQNSNNRDIVLDLIYELQYRRFASKTKKIQVLDKLIHLLTNQTTSKKQVYFPDDSQDTHSSAVTKNESDTSKSDQYYHYECIKKQRKEIYQNNYKSWREIGVLKASGYSVNQKDNLSSADRQAILDIVILLDDLNDIDDREYADEWGEPGSSTRLNKVKYSIKSFIKNAKKVNNRDMNLAILKWESDIVFINNNYILTDEI